MSAPLGLCGVDEAGRGPLAGPVMAAAVMLDPDRPIDGTARFKKLSAAARERWRRDFANVPLPGAWPKPAVAEIDRLNILHATMLAMQRAVAASARARRGAGGRQRCPNWAWRSQAVVKVTTRWPAIAAASILRKPVREPVHGAA